MVKNSDMDILSLVGDNKNHKVSFKLLLFRSDAIKYDISCKLVSKDFYITYKINGKLYRLDGPAEEWSDGTKYWYVNDKLHRLDGPAIEFSDGVRREWYINDKLHRLDGPAIEFSDGVRREWYVNGKLHRLDGPAVERSNGEKHWYIDGINYSEEEWKLKI